MTTPTPPEGGWKIIPAKYLEGHPLPGDAMVFCNIDGWQDSFLAGMRIAALRSSKAFYATREPLPCFNEPDWRKLCEELVERLSPFAKGACKDLDEGEFCNCFHCEAKEALTRAKQALNQEQQ